MAERDLTAAALAAVQGSIVRPVFFFEGEYEGGTLRLHTGVGNIDWDGKTWTGGGRLLEITPVRESRQVEAIGFSVRISGLESSILATTLAAMRKNKPGKIWLGFYEPSYVDFDFAGKQSAVAKVGASVATITCTRAGATATRVNSAGLIEVVAANTARIDFDAATLNCLGVLVEAAAINLALWNEDYGNAAWVKVGAGTTFTTDAAVSPTGATTADKFIPGNTLAGANARFHQVFTAVLNTKYTMSHYVKAAEQSRITFTNGGAFAIVETGAVTFDLAAGTVSSTGTMTGRMFPVGNGWWRCAVTVTATATPGTGVFQIEQWSGYTGNGTNGLYVTLGQIEAWAFLSSVVLTTSATVTRNNDDLVISDISGFYNSLEGTVLVDFDMLDPTQNIDAPLVSFNDATVAERIIPYVDGPVGTVKLGVVDGNVLQADVGNQVVAANTRASFASAWALNDFASSLNGSSVSTDGAGTLPTVTRMQFGKDPNTTYLNGHLARVLYAPRRLTDAEQVALAVSPKQVEWGSQRLVVDPYPMRRGRFDVAEIDRGADTVVIDLRYEDRLVDLERARERRYTHEDQQLRLVGDVGFNQVTDLQDAQDVWGESFGPASPFRVGPRGMPI